jgi:hypothetical protein
MVVRGLVRKAKSSESQRMPGAANCATIAIGIFVNGGDVQVPWQLLRWRGGERMTDEGLVGEAEATVADRRRRLAEAGERDPAELARALLELSRAYEKADRTSEAVAAAQEGVAVLSPAFLAKPAAMASAMQAVMVQYVSLAQRQRQEPDAALLTPIAQAMGGLTRAEDEADDAW